MKSRPVIGIVFTMLVALVISVVAAVAGSGISNAQVPGIDISFVPEFDGLVIGDSGTVEVHAANLPVGQADTIQVTLEYDSSVLSVDAARCAGLYDGANVTALVPVNNGANLSFSCVDSGLPGAASGVVAEIDITRIAAGDSEVSFLQTDPFSTSIYFGGTEQPIQSFGTLTVIDGVIDVMFVPGTAGISNGSTETVEIHAADLIIGQADTVQISLEFDPSEITVAAARCIGLYSTSTPTALISINNGAGVSFACTEAGLPGAEFGAVAEIDVTHTADGDSLISFLEAGVFRTAFIDAGNEQGISSFGSLIVTDDVITPGFDFQPSSTSLSVGGSGSIGLASGLIVPGTADTVQVSIIHDDSVISIDSATCTGLYTGATATSLARVENDTATAFSCTLVSAPLGELGVFAEISITRVGGGTATLSFGATGPFRTAFINEGVEVSQGRLETLTVLDSTAPAPTATTPPSSGGGGGGGFSPPPTAAPSGPSITFPSAPQNVSFVVGDGTVTIRWEPPASNGGDTISGYRILNILTGSSNTVAGTALSHTVTGLTNGVAYSFQLTAINSAGNGTAVIVGPATPQAPTGGSIGSAAKSAFGDNVEITVPKPSVSTDATGIKAVIGATGVTGGQLPAGGIKFESEDITIDVDETGTGTGTLILGAELSVTGSVSVRGSTDGIEIQFQSARLNFAPMIETAEQATLPAQVGTPAVSFNVGLNSVADGASVTATYGGVPSPDIVATTFSLQGVADPAVLDDPSADFAYTVTVQKTGLVNEQLGDNTVTMRVSNTWYAAMTAAGNAVVITKVDEAGAIFVEEAVCTLDGSERVCTATFSGAAGGFSDFSLLALTLQPVATPTPTVATGVTATPTTPPVPTSTPSPVAGSPTPVISAPTDPPTPVPSPTPEPTATSVAPTNTPAPSPTAVPQPIPTVPPVLPGDGGGGGVPAWVYILGALVAVGALAVTVATGLADPLIKRAKSAI